MNFVIFCSLLGLSRAYHLGFTAFPYDLTQEAVDWVREKVLQDGNIIECHHDGRVPWVDSFNDADYHSNVMSDLENLNDRPDNVKLLVDISPTDMATGRTQIALEWREEQDMDLIPPWDTYSFNHPNVKTAFLKFAKRVIEISKPDYLTIGIEVNVMLRNSGYDMNLWNEFLELHSHVYTELKKDHPNLPIMVEMVAETFTGVDDTYNQTAELQALNDIMPYTDYFALSYHQFPHYAYKIPTEQDIRNLFAMSDGKPIAIIETGYISEHLTILNGTWPYSGNEDDQLTFFQRLFNVIDETDNFEFVINFVYRDYPKLWEKLGKLGKLDLHALWMYTGLIRPEGTEKTVHELWVNKLRAQEASFLLTIL